MRSGSTWMFNAVRLLYRQAQVACDPYWIRILTEEKLSLRLQGGADVLVKTHSWWPWYNAMLSRLQQDVALETVVVLTHRDLRGVRASVERLRWLPTTMPIPRSWVDDHMEWRDVATLDIAYEDIVNNGLATLERLAAALRLHIKRRDAAEVLAELASLAAPKRGINRTTKILRQHREQRGNAAGMQNSTTVGRPSPNAAARSVLLAKVSATSPDSERYPDYAAAYGYE